MRPRPRRLEPAIVLLTKESTGASVQVRLLRNAPGVAEDDLEFTVATLERAPIPSTDAASTKRDWQ